MKVGVDGGQGWLKMGLTVTDREEKEQTGRSHYSEVKFLYIFLIGFKELPLSTNFN